MTWRLIIIGRRKTNRRGNTMWKLWQQIKDYGGDPELVTTVAEANSYLEELVAQESMWQADALADLHRDQ